MKRKELFVKSVIVITGLLLIASLVILFMAELNPEKYRTVSAYVFASFCAFCIFMMIIIRTLKVDLTHKKAKPTKYNIKFDSFDEFSNSLSTTLPKYKYSDKTMLVKRYGTIEVYKKGSISSNTYFSLAYIDEINEKTNEEIENDIAEHVFSSEPNLHKDFNLILCICVRNTTDRYKKLIKTNTVQEYRRYKFITTVNFTEKKLYILNQKGGLFKGKYIMLRKQFFKVMGKNAQKTEVNLKKTKTAS